jgi:hypothetical protein
MSRTLIRNSTAWSQRIFVAIPSYQRQHKESRQQAKINLPKLNTISKKEKDENIELKAQKIDSFKNKNKTYYSIL